MSIRPTSMQMFPLFYQTHLKVNWVLLNTCFSSSFTVLQVIKDESPLEKLGKGPLPIVFESRRKKTQRSFFASFQEEERGFLRGVGHRSVFNLT